MTIYVNDRIDVQTPQTVDLLTPEDFEESSLTPPATGTNRRIVRY